MFLLNGFVLAGLMPRYPELKVALALDEAAFGLVLACVTIGSLCAFALPAPLIRRFGAVPVTLVGTVAMILCTLAIGFAAAWLPVVLLVVLLMAGNGFCDAVVDAAQNVHGLAVEKAYGSAIFSALHATWSIGSVAGGALGLGAAALGIPLWAHLTGVGLLAGGLCLWSASLARRSAHLVDGSRRTRTVVEHAGSSEPAAEAPWSSPRRNRSVDDPELAAEAHSPRQDPAAPVSPAWGLLALVIVLGVLGVLVEDVGLNWSAVYFEGVGGIPIGLAGAAYVVALGSQFVGRVLADGFTERFGSVVLIRLGGLLTALGMGLMMTVGTPWAVLVGFACTGFGSATFVPTAYAVAGRLPGFKHGTAVAITSWVLRIGGLVSSPSIGFLAAALGLRWAFLLPFLAGVVALLTAGTLRRVPPR